MIICSGTLGRAPFDEKAHAAASAGFTGISIYSREHRPGLRRLLDDLGLAVAEVDGAMAWLPGQPGPEPAEVLEIAADLGARSVTVLEATGTLPEGARDAFAELCELAGTVGVVPHIEPFPWSGIPSVADAMALVEGTGGRILLDTWHLVRGPDAGIVPEGADRLVMAVQVSDPAPSPWPSVVDESMHGRLPPASVTRSILEQLPDVPLEVEIFNDGLQALQLDTIAELARASLDVLVPPGNADGASGRG